MKTITLKFSGMVLSSAVSTMVTKVTDPKGESKIMVDALRNIEISLGGQSAESLGIEKNNMVTLTPVADSTDGSFTLEVQEKQASKPTGSTAGKGGSPSGYYALSNDDI